MPRAGVALQRGSRGWALCSQQLAVPSEGRELASQVLQAQPVAQDAQEVAERGQRVVEGEAPRQPPVPGVGGTELPAGLAGCQPQLLPQPVALLHPLQLSHQVRGRPPEALRVQHRGGDAHEEDDDLQGAKPPRMWGVKFLPQAPWLAAVWGLVGFFELCVGLRGLQASQRSRGRGLGSV